MALCWITIITTRGWNGRPPSCMRCVRARRARAGWKIHLASIAQASVRRANEIAQFAPGLPRQMVYIVDAAETRAAAARSLPGEGSGALIVELQSRHLKKSRLRGTGWTKGAPF